MEPQIIYEDKNFIAVNKPANLLTHPTVVSEKSGEKALTDFLAEKYPEIKNVGDLPAGRQAIRNMRPGVVHRLDKDTSGVILIARNQKYFEYLKKLFQDHKIKKIYTTLVWGKIEPKKGVIEKPIGLKPGTTKRTVHGGKMVKEAITEYEVKKYLHDPESKEYFSLVDVYPKTGRTHQIRVHFAAIHHSVIGDPIYGRKKNPFGLEKQFLHAEYVEFFKDDKPARSATGVAGGNKIKIEAPLPEDLKSILKNLDEV